MDIRQLRYFVAIADARGLSKASERLHVAQPALSLQLASLEEECGARLFERHPRGVSLTRAGSILLRHAQTILREVDNAAQAVRAGLGSIEGQVALGFPTTTTDKLVDRLLTAIRLRHPDIHLRLTETGTGMLATMLSEGVLDLAILMNAPEHVAINSRPLLLESYCLLSPPRVAPAGKSIEWNQVLGLPLLLPSHDSMLRQMLEAAALQAGSRLTSVADIDSARLLTAAVKSGMGHAILPWSSVSHHAEAGTLLIRMIRRPKLRALLQLASSTLRPATPAQLAVQDLVIEIVRQLVAERQWLAELHPQLAGPG